MSSRVFWGFLVGWVTIASTSGVTAQSEQSTRPHEAWEPFPVLPMIWWNDATDVTAGVWINTGPTDLGTFTVSASRGFGGFQASTLGETVDFFARVKDPPFLLKSDFRTSVAGWALDGTVGARVSLSRPLEGAVTGATLQWVATREAAYLDPALWDNAGTVEGWVFHDRPWSQGPWDAGIRLKAGGGTSYRFRGATGGGSRYTTTPYGRFSGEGTIRRRLGAVTAGARGYVGALLSSDPVPRQRRIGLKGADPYETLGNPLVRAEGAPLVNGDLRYHSPGHANLRGFRPGISGRWAAALNVELEADLFRPATGILRRVSLVGFWDGGVVDTLAVQSLSGRAYKVVADAGVGARIWLKLGALRFPVRVEFPFYVSEPALADDRRQGTDFVEFRWLISLQPIF